MKYLDTAALVFGVLAFIALMLWWMTRPDEKIAICPTGQHAQYIDSGRLQSDSPGTITVLVGCEKNGVNL